MLLKMKSYVEGMRSLIYYIAFCFDKTRTAEDAKEIEHYTNLVEILTPVVKAYSSEKGFDVCVEAMQVFGGYRYTREYPVEQMVRDCKIASIYEGANGIQAMDFFGRKVAGKKGVMLDVLVTEINQTIEAAKARDSLATYAASLEGAVTLLETTCHRTTQALFSEHVASAFACAHPLLEASGDVIMAWMLLWRATIADQKLDTRDARFYQGKIKAAQFFITTILPVTMGKLAGITCEDNPAASMEERLF